jgi:hypothetical protein
MSLPRDPATINVGDDRRHQWTRQVALTVACRDKAGAEAKPRPERVCVHHPPVRAQET